jgi:hypothetical protein
VRIFYQDQEDTFMRTLLIISTLLFIAAPAFAQIADDTVSIPEPSVIALIGIGGLAVLLGRRDKK